VSRPTPQQLLVGAAWFFAVGWLAITVLVMTADRLYGLGWAHPAAVAAAWFVMLGTTVLLVRAGGRALVDAAQRRGLLPW